MKPIVVAFTGASGVTYGLRTVQVLTAQGHSVELIVSEAARLVLREETEYPAGAYTRAEDFKSIFPDESLKLLKVHSPKDFTASVASGSYPTAGMIITPCSMGTLGAIASGISQNLIHRAADCMIKEGRRLVLVPRETPLSAIHLENMLKLARLGVRIVPAMPAFYSGAHGLEEMIDFMVGKTLDQLEIPHVLYPRWTGSTAAQKKFTERGN
jgi:flavin prenyltransferase